MRSACRTPQHIKPDDYYRGSLVFVPSLDLDVAHAHLAERAYERRGKAGVGDERYVEVDGGAAYHVAVAQFAFLQRARDIDHHIDLAVVYELQCVGELAFLTWLAHPCRWDAVVLEELVSAGRGIELVTLAVEHHRRLEHVGLLSRRAARQQYAALGDAQSD